MTSLVRYRSFLPVRDILDNFFSEGVFAPQAEFSGSSLAVDVKESEDEYVMNASVPGVKPGDLSIEIDDDVVAISVLDLSDREIGKSGYIVRERKVGYCRRKLRMPGVLDAGSATASLDNGVLSLTLPKSLEAKPKRIAVKVSS